MEYRQPKYRLSEALDRIKVWCDLQERAQQEVREKLYSWGLHQQEVESLIAELIGANYLNEERFARAYVSGKFRIKRWGRKKIINGLKFRKISSHCIRLGLQEIDDQEYESVIAALIEKKAATTKDREEYIRRQKIASYLVQRGYESELVWPKIESFFKA